MARRSASDAAKRMADAIRLTAKCLTSPLAYEQVDDRLDRLKRLAVATMKMLPTVDSWLEQRRPKEVDRFHYRLNVVQEGQKQWVQHVETKLQVHRAGVLPWAYGPPVMKEGDALPKAKSPLAKDARFRVAAEKLVTALECWARDAEAEKPKANEKRHGEVPIAIRGRRGLPPKYNAAKDEKLGADWKSAKRSRSTQKEFCKERDIKVKVLQDALTRIRERRNRAKATNRAARTKRRTSASSSE